MSVVTAWEWVPFKWMVYALANVFMLMFCSFLSFTKDFTANSTPLSILNS